MKTKILALFLAASTCCFAGETTLNLFQTTWKIEIGEQMVGTPLTWADVKNDVESFLSEKSLSGPVEKALENEATQIARRYDASVKALANQTGKTADELFDLFLMGKGGATWPKIQKAHNVMVGINHILDSTKAQPLVYVSDSKKKGDKNPEAPVPGDRKITPQPAPNRPVRPSEPKAPENNPATQPPRAIEW